MGVRIAASAALFVYATSAAAQDDAQLKRLVEQIAGANKSEAADATDELLDLLSEPVARALGSIENRPTGQKRRLYLVLGRLTARIRVQLFRAELPTGDRTLFDTFAQQYPELVERLFHDHADKRIAALEQLPIIPNSGASVLAAGKILFDDDASVVDAALKVAAKFHDPVTARGVRRFVRTATDDLAGGILEPGEAVVELVLAGYVQRAISILAGCNDRDATPDILEALEYFSKHANRVFFDIGEVALALGRLGDQRAADALMRYLDDDTARPVRSAGPGLLMHQTVGDVVLLSLLRIYKLDPSE